MVTVSSTVDFEFRPFTLAQTLFFNTGDASEWHTTAPENVFTPIQRLKGTFDGLNHTFQEFM